MLILLPIFIGLSVGSLVAITMHSHKSLFRNLIVSVVGALFVRLLTHIIIILHRGSSDTSFSISLVSSLLGSILFTFVYNLLPEVNVNDEE